MGRKIYILMSVLAVTIFSMQKFEILLPKIINNYANDLLCLPLVLAAIAFAIRRLKKDPNFKFPLVFVLIMAAYYSVYFEYYLPKNNPRYTADYMDVIVYFCGSLAFYFYEKSSNYYKKYRED